MSNVLTNDGQTPQIIVPPLLLSAQILAKRLGVSVRTLWRLRTSGKLPQPVRLGGAIRWRATEIDAWIAAGCPDREAWKVRITE
jgi:excisionase family DNA binding protein